MYAREKKEKAIAMYDTTQSITEVIRRRISDKQKKRRKTIPLSVSLSPLSFFLAIYKIIHSTLVLVPAFLII